MVLGFIQGDCIMENSGCAYLKIFPKVLVFSLSFRDKCELDSGGTFHAWGMGRKLERGGEMSHSSSCPLPPQETLIHETDMWETAPGSGSLATHGS